MKDKRPYVHEILLRVTAPTFVAGAVARNGRIVEAAPILQRHVIGMTSHLFTGLCKRMGWTWISTRRMADGTWVPYGKSKEQP